MQVAFDDQEKIAYLIGGSQLYLIDLSPVALLEAGSPAQEPKSLSVLETFTLDSTINDVAVCGDLLAVALNGPTKVLPGSVTLFSRFLRASQGPGLEQLAQFTVGEYSMALTTQAVLRAPLHGGFKPAAAQPRAKLP